MTCPSCGKEPPGEFPFCPFCGAALTQALPGPGREERKVVTVLFADLVGFTARAERLDPEDVRRLLSPYHARLRSELERFGGTVEKFVGDAVMGLFGAPVAHEDDPERAVRAALAIRDWVSAHGEELQVRLAVNTGEALVSLDARPQEGESMAAGDVVNTAARLQAAAPVNGILVGESTYRATEAVIEYRRAEPVAGKGKREPIPAWEGVRARSASGVGVWERSVAPLVGRGRELELLVSALARVCDERSSQLVTLVGVPGIGKSRLVLELFRSVERGPAPVRWYRGRSLPYGDGVTFWALAEAVKAYAGILESDAPEQAGAKLGRALNRVAVDTGEAQWLERHLRPLAGLAEETPGGREEGFAAWRRLFEALAEERPLVLVLEDLHWADHALLDFVDQLVDRARGVPLLVLGTARPELLERRPGWGGGKPNALTISLPPLTDEEIGRILHATLEQLALETENEEALLARAGGNPLFAEQYARILLERGAAPDLPETVHGIIAARLDGLSDEEKRLLQSAAVIGKVFWLGALEAVDGIPRWQAEEVLYALQRKEFVERARASSVASETEYAFRHVLIRDVAYGQIPRAARSRNHQQAAAWIESLGRPDDHAEMLAYHYLQALELAEAAGIDDSTLVDSARHALRDAGDRAAALHAADVAVRFYDAALRLWPEDDLERPELLFRCAVPIGHHVAGGDPERLARARDALLAAGERARAAEAEMLIAQSFWIQGRRELADRHGERALELLGEGSPSRSRAWVLARLATRASLTGDHARAIEIATEARDVSAQLRWDEGISDALGVLGLERVFLGDADGLSDLRQSVELAARGELGNLARTLTVLSVGHQVLGDLESAYRVRLESREVADRIGSESLLLWFQGVLSDHLYRLGEWDEALRTADDFIARVEAGSPNVIAWQPYAVRAEIRLARDDEAGAVIDTKAALAAGRAVDEVQALCFVLAVGAHVFSLASLRDAALRCARDLLDAVRLEVTMEFAVINLPLFASAAVRLGIEDEVRSGFAHHPSTPWTDALDAYLGGDFVTAAGILRQAGARPDEADARLHAARQLASQGCRAEAGKQLEEALAFFRSVRASRYLRECESLLAAAAE